MNAKQKHHLITKLYNVYANVDYAMEWQDIEIWVDYYAGLGYGYTIVRNKTLDRMRSSDEYKCRSRHEYECSKSIDEYQFDENAELRYYFVMTVDGVEDDVINKIWYEKWKMQYDGTKYASLPELLRAGYRHNEIAEMFSISESQVSLLLRKPPKQTHTYLGKPCKRGHKNEQGQNERYKSNGKCCQCQREDSARHRADATTRTP